MIWIEQNDRVFNYEQWHESKIKHLIWDNLILYAKVAWDRVVKFVKISPYSAKPFSKALMKLGGLGMCFVDGLENHVELETPTYVGTWHVGHLADWGLGIVFGWVGGLVGCPWWGSCFQILLFSLSGSVGLP